MKNLQKLISVVIAAVLLFSMFAFSVSAEEKNTVILYTNDVHCAVDSYAVLAAYRAELIGSSHSVITVDAGDAIQGEVIGLLSEGADVAELMNMTGYDFAVPGNHEFDYGLERFLELAEEEAEYQYLSSNFYNLQMAEPVFDAYAIKEVNGIKIAFVGISTPETLTKTTPEYFKDENGNFIYSFPAAPSVMTDEVLYTNVQESVDSAINEGADIVVAVGHLGILETTDGWKSTDVIAHTDGIDFFIDAHSHETIESAAYKNKNDEDVILTSTGTKLKNFGAMTISESGEVTFELISPESVEIDSLSESAKNEYNRVNEKISEIKEEINYLYEPIGQSEAKLITYDTDGSWLVRRQETNMGDFVTDAYIAVADADIGLANSGSVRSTINAGPVARYDLMNVHPFGNELWVSVLTGQQILDALEFGAKDLPDASGGFLQVSHTLTYEIDIYKESPVTVDEIENFTGIDPSKERRVKNVMFKGAPIDPDREYRVAGTKYLLQQGGDGFTMLDTDYSESVGCVDSDALISYLINDLNGVILAEEYGNAADRIIINTEDAVENCAHICHSDNFFLKLLWKIINFFNMLLSRNDICDCGAVHYNGVAVPY